MFTLLIDTWPLFPSRLRHKTIFHVLLECHPPNWCLGFIGKRDFVSHLLVFQGLTRVLIYLNSPEKEKFFMMTCICWCPKNMHLALCRLLFHFFQYFICTTLFPHLNCLHHNDFSFCNKKVSKRFLFGILYFRKSSLFQCSKYKVVEKSRKFKLGEAQNCTT